MRKIRYAVAMSLDGYIAGPNGEFDRIVMDPSTDSAAAMASKQLPTGTLLPKYALGR